MRNSSDLFVGILLSIAATGSILLLPEGHLLRVVLGLLLVLLLPGFAVTAFAFPNPDVENSIDTITRLVYCLGSSLALCAIGGLALHLSPTGLTDSSWLLFLNSIIWIATIGALVRRAISHHGVTGYLSGLRRYAAPMLLTTALVILVVVGSVSIARNGAAQQPTTRFTQLWLQPTDPRLIAASDTSLTSLTIGVVNKEQEFMHYTLLVTDPAGSPLYSTKIALDADQTWQQTILLPSTLPAEGQVTAWLYRGADQSGQVYRRVTYDLSPGARQ